jgi:hypothetical protein
MFIIQPYDTQHKWTGKRLLNYGAGILVTDILPILLRINFLFIFCSSRAVRAHWGHLVRTGVVKKDYRHISINNIITLGTRIRITILKVSFQISESVKYNDIIADLSSEFRVVSLVTFRFASVQNAVDVSLLTF